MRHRYGAALGAATALLLMGTAACGGSGDGERPADSAPAEEASGQRQDEARAAVQAAARSAQEVTSASFTAELSQPGPPGEMRVTGAVSWAEPVALQATTTGDWLGLGAGGEAAEVELIVVDEALYVNVSDGLGESADVEWLGLEAADLEQLAGEEAPVEGSPLGPDGPARDPAQQMQLLLASPDISLVGEEELHGQAVRHYAGTVSVREALADGSELGEEQRRRLSEALETQGAESYEVDVWLDGNDFPIRVREAYDTDQGPVSCRIDYADLGRPVQVSAPPADRVTDLSGFLSALLDAELAGQGSGGESSDAAGLGA